MLTCLSDWQVGVAWVDVGGVEHRFGCDTEGNRYAVNDEEYLTFNRMEYVNQDNQSVYANIRYDNTSNTNDNSSNTHDNTSNTHDNSSNTHNNSNTHDNTSNTHDNSSNTHDNSSNTHDNSSNTHDNIEIHMIIV